MNKFKIKTKATAEEDFPKALKDEVKSSSWTYKRDANGNYVQDAKGREIRIPDHEQIKAKLKDYGKMFAENGFAISDLKFDDYLQQGIILSKFVKGCVNVLLMRNGELYVYDYRKEHKDRYSDKGFIWKGSEDHMTRSRDGKWVAVKKIPDAQMLEQARYVWIIPEEDIKNTLPLREERKKRIPDNRYKRYLTEEEKKKDFAWGGWKEKKFDKNGYLIDYKDLERRLDKYKNDKLARGGLIKTFNEELVKVIAEYNQIVSETLDNFNKITRNSEGFIYGKDLMRSFRDFWDYADEVKGTLESWQRDCSYYKDEDSLDNYEKNEITKYIKSLSSFWKSTNHYGQNMVNTKDEIAELLDKQQSSSTESFKGQSHSRELRRSSDYFISKSIFESLDGDGNV